MTASVTTEVVLTPAETADAIRNAIYKERPGLKHLANKISFDDKNAATVSFYGPERVDMPNEQS